MFFTMSIDTAIVVLPLCMAFFSGFPFFLYGFMKSDYPAQQVIRTFTNLGSKSAVRTKAQNRTGTLFGDKDDDGSRAEKLRHERERIDLWLQRLGKRQRYEDIVAQEKTLMFGGLILGGTTAFMGMAIGDTMITGFGVALIPVFGFASMTIRSSIQGQIKTLNKSILFELPVLIKIFAEMQNKVALHTQLEDYLKQAGALRQDIKMCIADIKNVGTSTALVNLSNRIQSGDKVEEVGQFVDQVRSLYSGGEPIMCSQNLNLLADRIYETHINEYVKRQADKKIAILQICVMVSVCIVFFLYISPTIIQIAEDMKSLQ